MDRGDEGRIEGGVGGSHCFDLDCRLSECGVWSIKFEDSDYILFDLVVFNT